MTTLAAPVVRQLETLPSLSFDFLVFIGRFQPFHRGHLKVVLEALDKSERVIIIVGSVNRPRDIRNPWLYEEREAMIIDSLPSALRERVIVLPLQDHLYNDPRWRRSVNDMVMTTVRVLHDFETDPRIGLIGYKKDGTSYYLKKFPQWESVGVTGYTSKDDFALAATHMRDALFSNISEAWLRGGKEYLPKGSLAHVTDFLTSPHYKHVLDEYEFIRDGQAQWANSPHVPTFNTTDAVVLQNDHVLVVERKARPGKGLLALPGGYIDPALSLEDSMLKELRQETCIKLEDQFLRDHILFSHTFADPLRDPRGRYITQAFMIKLPDAATLPIVRGADDAEKAMWKSLPELDQLRQKMFIDHPDIINVMMARLDQQ